PEEKNDEKKSDNPQVVHTKSISIKGVLKGKQRDIPLEDEEIDENDQITRVEKLPQKEGLQETDIREAWNAYAEKIRESHPRQYTTLTQHRPCLQDDGVISVELSTAVQQENFNMNIRPGLVNYFRQNLKNIDYQIETAVMKKAEEGNRIYTDQDKLSYLMKKNKGLEMLKSRFNLDFDQ
ncbi:MAG TPA: hypothetical protein VJ951_04820, partial [Bacteroidales bacterium]|nr:hypothetical protein [Bacteroidales bacterium]